MKIGIAHNFYQSSSPSGENGAVLRDIDLLRSEGHEVSRLFRSSDELSLRSLLKTRVGVGALARSSKFVEWLEGEQLDLIHVHNLFPLITSAVVRAAKSLNVPVVATLHNYRLSCAAGTHFRDGRICEDCTGRRVPLPAIRHACYRDSYGQTAPVVANQVLDRELLLDLDQYICLTPYMKDRLVARGVAPSRITVRPTGVPGPPEASVPGRGLAFIGRLSEDKGVDLLLDAWSVCSSRRDHTLTIVGDGPLRGHISERILGVEGASFLGPLDRVGVASELEKCAALVVPSLWYEGFPTVVSEAFSHGRPVLAVRNPNSESFVRNCGWLSGSTVDELASAIDRSIANKEVAQDLGERAREFYERWMSPAASSKLLISAYASAVANT